VRRIRASGAEKGTSCKPSVSVAVLAPRPSTNRPPEMLCSVAAAIASVPALRFQTPMIPLARRMRAVRTAISVSSTGVS
jgi:hypothetical protein